MARKKPRVLDAPEVGVFVFHRDDFPDEIEIDPEAERLVQNRFNAVTFKHARGREEHIVPAANDVTDAVLRIGKAATRFGIDVMIVDTEVAAASTRKKQDALKWLRRYGIGGESRYGSYHIGFMVVHRSLRRHHHLLRDARTDRIAGMAMENQIPTLYVASFGNDDLNIVQPDRQRTDVYPPAMQAAPLRSRHLT